VEDEINRTHNSHGDYEKLRSSEQGDEKGPNFVNICPSNVSCREALRLKMPFSFAFLS
jgi:hypothetical protein